MSNFFDKFTGKKQNGGGKKSGGKNNKNPFAKVGKTLSGPGHRKFQGTGQSLGGSQPGKVIQVMLPDPGPLGMEVRRR